MCFANTPNVFAENLTPSFRCRENSLSKSSCNANTQSARFRPLPLLAFTKNILAPTDVFEFAMVMSTWRREPRTITQVLSDSLLIHSHLALMNLAEDVSGKCWGNCLIALAQICLSVALLPASYITYWAKNAFVWIRRTKWLCDHPKLGMLVSSSARSGKSSSDASAIFAGERVIGDCPWNAATMGYVEYFMNGSQARFAPFLFRGADKKELLNNRCFCSSERVDFRGGLKFSRSPIQTFMHGRAVLFLYTFIPLVLSA